MVTKTGFRVFYYNSASAIWSDKRCGLRWEWPDNTDGLLWEWRDKRCGLQWEWPDKKGDNCTKLIVGGTYIFSSLTTT